MIRLLSLLRFLPALLAQCGMAAVVESAGDSLTPPGVKAEAVDMLFRNWTTREGLPHNRVRTVIRSRDGFLWLGTDAGVARFDGVEFGSWGLAEGLGGGGGVLSL